MGIQQVNAIPRGQNTLYMAEVRIFSDSHNAHRVSLERAKTFLCTGEKGRRFPLLRDVSFVDADVNVKPGKSVKSSLTFLAPANAQKLYLISDDTRAALGVSVFWQRHRSVPQAHALASFYRSLLITRAGKMQSSQWPS
jgi:hypothetical protein